MSLYGVTNTDSVILPTRTSYQLNIHKTNNQYNNDNNKNNNDNHNNTNNKKNIKRRIYKYSSN